MELVWYPNEEALQPYSDEHAPIDIVLWNFKARTGKAQIARDIIGGYRQIVPRGTIVSIRETSYWYGGCNWIITDEI